MEIGMTLQTTLVLSGTMLILLKDMAFSSQIGGETQKTLFLL